MIVYVTWDKSDLDDNPPPDGNYRIGKDIGEESDPADYLTDKYGFLVESVTTVRG